mgnify:CR=1 FL=1
MNGSATRYSWIAISHFCLSSYFAFWILTRNLSLLSIQIAGREIWFCKRFMKRMRPKRTPPPIQDILSSAMKYLLTAHLSQTDQVDIKKDGFHTVASLAGGFSLIKRSVPEQMVEKGAADILPRTALLPSNKDARRFAGFFSHLRTADNEAILGEDQSFC